MTADRDALTAQVFVALNEVRIHPGPNALAQLADGTWTGLPLSGNEKRDIAELAVSVLIPPDDAPKPRTAAVLNHGQLVAIALVARGLTCAAAGRALYITSDAVRVRIAKARKQTGAKSTNHLIALCMSRQLIPHLREDHL